MTTTTASSSTQRGVGRPALPAADRLDRRTKVGLNPAETVSINAAAAKARLTRSAWIRHVILLAANAHTESA